LILSGVMPSAMRDSQHFRVVLPRRRGCFARMKSGVGLQRRCWTRRSFEPILNLRVPGSDGPCAWPAADFGSLRESLKAGAGRPLFTGGSGSSSTRRSGPLHFLWNHAWHRLQPVGFGGERDYICLGELPKGEQAAEKVVYFFILSEAKNLSSN